MVATAGLELYRSAANILNSLGVSRSKLQRTNRASPHFDGAAFHNVLLSHVLSPDSFISVGTAMLRRGAIGKPNNPIPLRHDTAPTTAADLAVTWYGHASALIEIDGHFVLADPVWGNRVSPSTSVGPKRLHAVPVPLESLPNLSAIVISHDHYDHLDLPTIKTLIQTQQAPFLVPIGVGAHLRQWGVPENRIVELDWSGQHVLEDLTLTCTEARHFSGRGLTRNDTLWASWALAGPVHRVFFGGDTGYTPAFADIGAQYGPFDLTLLPIGAYDERWPDIHLDPEEAVQAHQDLRGKNLLPIHWATFDLAFHPWAEPVQRLLAAAEPLRVELLIPQPGPRIQPGESAKPWWNAVTWNSPDPHGQGPSDRAGSTAPDGC